MTRTEQIAAIRAACIKVNPEIVELKFGCQLDYVGKRQTILRHVVNDAWELWPSMLVVSEAEIHYNRLAEIIGRTIRLADVLLAILESNRTTRDYNEGWSDVCSKWNLRTDDLEQQSDETISFIYPFIGVI